MPGVWATDVRLLLNIIQHGGVTPHGWHVDLMHYVHKSSDGSSLSNQIGRSLLWVYCVRSSRL